MPAMSAHLSESTATLLSRVRGGDRAARERLCATYLPLLNRWARGRLPAHARDLCDTNDLVQMTLIAALDRVDDFRPRREGAFLAYLRTALMNAVRMELRRVGRRGGAADALDEAAVPEALHGALEADRLLDYETALAKLKPVQREAVILRFEFGMEFAEIAAALERNSAAAAHMIVARALLSLAEELGDAPNAPA
jgi:RNA polymerase sigma factor (sigma-70 family)